MTKAYKRLGSKNIREILKAPDVVFANSEGIGVGASLFQVRGCITCHTIDEKGGKRGPDLFNVACFYDIETLKRMILDPKSLNPASQMPPQRQLTEEELNKISEFLINLK